MHYLILDLEATCWSGYSPASRQEIIEIGLVRLSHFGRVHGTFQRFVRPGEFPDLSQFCKDLTGIQQEQVDAAASFAVVHEQLLDWLDEAEEEFLVCAWGDKDKLLLLEECVAYGLDGQLYTRYLDLKKAYHEFRNLKHRQGLMKTLEKEGFEFEGVHHRALDDAKNLTKLFLQYLDSWAY